MKENNPHFFQHLQSHNRETAQIASKIDDITNLGNIPSSLNNNKAIMTVLYVKPLQSPPELLHHYIRNTIHISSRGASNSHKCSITGNKLTYDPNITYY